MQNTFREPVPERIFFLPCHRDIAILNRIAHQLADIFTPGSRYLWKVEHGEFFMVNLNPGHFITSNDIAYDSRIPYLSSNAPSDTAVFDAISLGDTELLKEQIFIDRAEKVVLFGYKVTDSHNGAIYAADRAGWYKKARKGYLFYFVAGHSAKDFKNANFSQAILNCLLWDEWE